MKEEESMSQNSEMNRACLYHIFSPLAKHKLCNFTISVREVTKRIKTLDSRKGTNLNEIPVVVLENFNLVLTLVFENLFYVTGESLCT